METLRRNWPTYVVDGICLGLFMVSAATWATVLQHPDSPVRVWIGGTPGETVLSRVPMGIAMGATAVALIYSPLGARSGAHMNPAVTLTFLWLGRLSRTDAAGYVAAQIAGGLAGFLIAVAALGAGLSHPAVNYVATEPQLGVGTAFIAEAGISFVMMTAVLELSARARFARLTGLAAGLLIALFIAVEAPLSGMSMNVARTLPSNLWAARTSTLWLYATAPLLGMWLAAVRYVRWPGLRRDDARVACAKLHHDRRVHCIFCEEWHD